MTEATPAPQPAAPAAPLSESDDKLWASLSHFGGILYILPSLIIWLVLKDRTTKTKVEAKEALNWQITFLIGYIALWIIYAIIAGIFTAIAVGTGAYGVLAVAGLFYFLPLVLWVLNVVFSIIGGVRVQQGGSYRYPISFRFIK
jgi:uncharacterized Tic20 family protein